MVRQVIWQNKAVKQFESIQNYLIEEWGDLSNAKFTKKIFRLLELIRRYPEIGSLELAERNIRGYTVTRQTRMLYQVKDQTIYILAFFDNRQDPSRKFNN